MFKKNLFLIISVLIYPVYGQVGINTEAPQGVIHVDGAKDNPLTNTPSTEQQANDFVVKPNGSIGIGTNTPDGSAVMDITSTNKGFLMPRVNLTSNTLSLVSSGNAEGLLVYNIGTTLRKGLHFWNGTKWESIIGEEEEEEEVEPFIEETLICEKATFSPSFYTQDQHYEGELRIPYIGGNGVSYASSSQIFSTGVQGLIAQLDPGTLQYGKGELIFRVVGRPTASSPNTATFNIPTIFSTPGCTVTVGNDEFKVGETRSFSYTAPLSSFRQQRAQELPRMTGKGPNDVQRSNSFFGGNIQQNLLSETAGFTPLSPGLIRIKGLLMDFRYISDNLIGPVLYNFTPFKINYSITSLSTYDRYINGVNTTIAEYATSFRTDGDGRFGFSNNNESEFVYSQITFPDGQWYFVSWSAKQINGIVEGYVVATRLF